MKIKKSLSKLAIPVLIAASLSQYPALAQASTADFQNSFQISQSNVNTGANSSVRGGSGSSGPEMGSEGGVPTGTATRTNQERTSDSNNTSSRGERAEMMPDPNNDTTGVDSGYPQGSSMNRTTPNQQNQSGANQSDLGSTDGVGTMSDTSSPDANDADTSNTSNLILWLSVALLAVVLIGFFVATSRRKAID